MVENEQLSNICFILELHYLMLAVKAMVISQNAWLMVKLNTPDGGAVRVRIYTNKKLMILKTAIQYVLCLHTKHYGNSQKGWLMVKLKGGGHENLLLAILEPWVEYCSHNFWEIFCATSSCRKQG